MDKLKIDQFWYEVEKKMPELFLQYGLGKEMKEYFVEETDIWEEQYHELENEIQDLETEKDSLEDEVRELEQRCEYLEGIIEENDIEYD